MKRKGFSEADWDILKDEMAGILIGIARLRLTISYSELASQLTSTYVHHRAPYFHRLIDEVCDDFIAAGHPSPGVLIVRKDSGICGAGFFTHAANNGADVSDPRAYWLREFNRICDYWSEH